MIRLLALAAIGSLAACGAHHHGDGTDAGGGSDGGGPQPLDAFTGPYDDFGGDPIIDSGAPTNAGSLFGAPTSGSASGGPCLVEPEVGTLYPNNWLRPRFTWVATGTEDLFELRLTAANEINPLVVYTTATQWTMPADMWAELSAHIVDAPITMTVRGATFDGTMLTSGPELGSTGDIAIAPVAAPGSIVYWTTSGGTGLRGFHIGDESVTDIVTPGGAGTACVGCHSSTPDGLFVGFSASPDAGNGDPASLALRSADGMESTPAFITPSAQTLMNREYQELPAFTARHWQDGDHKAIATYTPADDGRTDLVWVDLEASATDEGVGWGVIGRTDGAYAGYPSFAHGSDTILYERGTSVSAGVNISDGDIYTVPFAGGAGGTSTPVAGASDPAYNEFYPTLSPDDQLVAFDRVAAGQSNYSDAASEVYVVPLAGGSGTTPTRLAANDPPVCSGQVSPGVTNSWPKWSPAATVVDTRTFYWLTFSSTRSAGGSPQLYVTPVVVDGGVIKSYPALYLWNQPAADHNHTPAWDNFDVPVQ